MDSFKQFVLWFAAHRAPMGAVFLGLSSIFLGAGEIYDAVAVNKLGQLAGLIGTTLIFAGLTDSDAQHKGKQGIVKTGIDRRGGRTQPIPYEDLKAVVNKEIPDPKG